MKNDKEHNEEKEKDALEQFVNQHLDEFNTMEPSEDLFDNIEFTVPSKRNKSPEKEAAIIPMFTNWKSWAGVAAVAAMVVSIVYLSIRNYQMNQTFEQQMAMQKDDSLSTVSGNHENSVEFSLASVSPEMAEVEFYYATEINSKLKKAKDLQVDDEMLEEIDLLNQEFMELKKEMTNSINDEQIIEAMIDNYRLKLELLNHILEEYKSKNTSATPKTTNQEIEI